MDRHLKRETPPTEPDDNDLYPNGRRPPPRTPPTISPQLPNQEEKMPGPAQPHTSAHDLGTGRRQKRPGPGNVQQQLIDSDSLQSQRSLNMQRERSGQQISSPSPDLTEIEKQARREARLKGLQEYAKALGEMEESNAEELALIKSKRPSAARFFRERERNLKGKDQKGEDEWEGIICDSDGESDSEPDDGSDNGPGDGSGDVSAENS